MDTPIDTLVICQDDINVYGNSVDSEDDDYCSDNNHLSEDIFALDNITYNNGIIYPPNPKFIESYNLWHEHQSVMWSSHETHPELDRDSFVNLEPEFRTICLKMISFLMWGDSVVIDIMETDMIEQITSREVRTFIADQIARENIHQEVYSKMLDVTSPDESEYYRSVEFRDEHLQQFELLSKKYRNLNNPAVFFYFIMICECIMFAPMFQTICYLAYIGGAPILGSANMQIMRDESIHYRHARSVLSQFKRKLPKTLAREILADFMDLIESLIESTVGTYKSRDGLFSLDVCIKHFNHVCAGFMRENSLFYNSFEERQHLRTYKTTPAKIYMDLSQREVRSNLMESQSTIYAVASGSSSGVSGGNSSSSSSCSRENKLTLSTKDMGDW